MRTETAQAITQAPAIQRDRIQTQIPPVQTSLVSSSSGFDALRADWDDLLERSEARVFQTYEWQRTWWKHFGEGRRRLRLYLIVIREGKTVIGIAPLFVEQVPVLGPLGYRRLSFIGRGTSDYLDLIIARGKEEPVFAELTAFLTTHREDADVVLLEDIHDGSVSQERLLPAIAAAGFSGERFLSEYCPRTALRSTWEETVRTFPGAHRNRLMKVMSRLTDEYHTEFEHVQDPAQVEAAMGDFIRMHQARWNVVGHQGVFADPATDRFHRDVALRLHKRGWLFLAFLKMNGERFAGDYGLIFRKECYTYLGGTYDAGEVNRHSPGTVLRMNIMRECHALGVQIYDFMRGTERYKYTLGAVNVPNWTVLMFRRDRRTASMLHTARLFRDSIVRRSVHEWSSMLHHARKSGPFSKEFAVYLAKACRTIVMDATQKAREPEKSLVIGRDHK